MKKISIKRIFCSILTASLTVVGLSVPAKATGANFLVTTVGATTAGFVKTFNITATTNGSTTNGVYTPVGSITVTSSDAGATFLLGSFSGGVMGITVTFSASGNFTVTATDSGVGGLVGTSASITVDPAIASTSVIQIGTTNPTVTITTTQNLEPDPVEVGDFEYNFGTTGLTTALSLSRVSNREVIITFSPGPVTAGTLKIKARPSAFVETTSVDSNELSFTATAAPPSSGGGGGGAPAPVVVAPVVVAPGARVSGTKWSVVTGADGITRARVSVGTQFRGKNAVFFKRLKNGKLVRVGTGKVGKAGRANLQTRVKFKEGQKIRVQVDGKFRSTISIS